mmetsp:Transcript_20661/g.51644  ORF Transcript_20661/g.51644 Transcript_20661/m.51644 type:complete len:90 (-) Transcript_20661:357-626(-)
MTVDLSVDNIVIVFAAALSLLIGLSRSSSPPRLLAPSPPPVPLLSSSPPRLLAFSPPPRLLPSSPPRLLLLSGQVTPQAADRFGVFCRL